MTNYKGEKRAVVGTWFSYPVHDGHKLIALDENVDASNAADGFHDISTGVIYQVTAGKTFRMLRIQVRIGTPGAASTLVISSGDTENAETATLLTLKLPNQAGNQYYQVDKELASAKFLTHNPSGTDVIFINIVGYEY